MSPSCIPQTQEWEWSHRPLSPLDLRWGRMTTEGGKRGIGLFFWQRIVRRRIGQPVIRERAWIRFYRDCNKEMYELTWRQMTPVKSTEMVKLVPANRLTEFSTS